MQIEFDNVDHCDDFIRLNEQWISQHFSIEEADRKLAANPFKIVSDGGHIISLVESLLESMVESMVENGRVVGVCALFKINADRYELARMAVEPRERGKVTATR